MKKLRIWCKWKYYRWKVKLKNNRELQEDEKLIRSVVVNLSSNKKNSILFSPLSKTIYLQTVNKEYTVVLEEHKIKISNHKMFIESYIDEFFSKELFQIVYHYVEKFRLQLESELFNNEVDGLNYMLNKLNKK
jgi:hypothetical protein